MLAGSLGKEDEEPLQSMVPMKGTGKMDEFGRFGGVLGFQDGSEIRNPSPSFGPAPKNWAKTKQAEYKRRMAEVKTGKFIDDTCFARESPLADEQVGKRILLWLPLDQISIHYDAADKTLGPFFPSLFLKLFFGKIRPKMTIEVIFRTDVAHRS